MVAATKPGLQLHDSLFYSTPGLLLKSRASSTALGFGFGLRVLGIRVLVGLGFKDLLVFLGFRVSGLGLRV